MKRFVWFLALFLLLPAGLAAGDKKTNAKKILLITESKGFRHGCVARKVTVVAKEFDLETLPKSDSVRVQGGNAFYDGRIDAKGIEIKAGGRVVLKAEPCVVEKTFIELGEKTGMFHVVCSQDSRSEITAERLKDYDAVFFYTTGELPLSDTQKSDLLAFIASGKGFAGSHCATDTNYKWKDYGELIGGYFDGHPWHQKIKVIVEDRKHPATRHLGESFEITDEIYQFRTPYSREKLHILMKLDMGSVKTTGNRKDGDNALA